MYTDISKSYSIIESAQILGLTVPTVRLLIRKGEIKEVHYEGRKMYIEGKEINRFIDERIKAKNDSKTK